MGGQWRWFWESQLVWLVFWGLWAILVWLLVSRVDKPGGKEEDEKPLMRREIRFGKGAEP